VEDAGVAIGGGGDRTGGHGRTVSSRMPQVGSGGGRSGELGLDGDLDLVGDQHATGLQRRVPGQTELLAGDRGAAGEAGAVDAEGVGGGALVGEVQHDGPGGAADGQVAVERVALELGGD